jgi:hypothetical protein
VIAFEESEDEGWEIDPRHQSLGTCRSQAGRSVNRMDRGIATGVISYADDDKWLHVGDDVHEPFDLIIERAPDLDPFAFRNPSRICRC